ncbi:hypothetical protein BOTCAL_0033g00370 [Botryotinia calthae]|uniref:Uncharacterized protein n=1 Tax=Botryotinia calthae TaxID=38488 RepID=A0A4Y8DFD0_9HELO|nr:hypothetical protein BOTCAL_0033g00370 [Botryotinia calthae]
MPLRSDSALLRISPSILGSPFCAKLSSASIKTTGGSPFWVEKLFCVEFLIRRRAILNENLLVRRRSRFSQDIMSRQALKAMLAILADKAGTKLGRRDIILLQRSSSFIDTQVSESLS